MLGHRIVGPRDVVLSHDPAIDQQASNVVAYHESLFDFSAGHVKVKPGEKPTLWKLGPLTEAQKRQAKALNVDSAEWADYVIRCALHGVQNYLVVDNGSEREVSTVDRKDRPGMGEMASMEWLDRSGIRFAERAELAQIAWIISEAGLPLSKPSEPPAGP